jgi:putative DNA primase/helicase
MGWVTWTGQFWRPDPTEDGALATGFVRGLARSIAEEVAALYALAAAEDDKETRKALFGLAMERNKWAIQSENASTIAAGLKLAKGTLLLDHDQINARPWLFNCQNGTVDLTTGQLRPHAPADLLTQIAPVTYDAQATCPTWTRFLEEVFAGDQSMAGFLQRAIGWSLTGVVQDRALFLLYGAQGHNGKTTLVEVVRDLLGTSGEEGFGYARKVDVQTFMKSKNYEDNLRKAAQLVGARFVYSSEIAEEHRLNEQLIKDMTGGDTPF